jgi:diacylglycerol kinase family enzyme
VLMIDNVAAGRRKRRRDPDCLQRLLESEGFEVRRVLSLEETNPDEHLDLAVVCGGDGTLNRAASFLFDRSHPIAILPMGFWNNICRIYRLPCDVHGIRSAIVEDRKSPVPVGRIGDEVFFSNASCGYKSAVSIRMQGVDKRRWWVFSYLRPSLLTWLRLPRYRFRLEYDDGCLDLETPLLGVVPDLDEKGPFLRVLFIRHGGMLAFPFQATRIVIGAMLRRDIRFPGVVSLKTRRLEISGDTGPFNLDGETCHLSRISMEAAVSPSAIYGLEPCAPLRHSLLLKRQRPLYKWPGQSL